MDAARAPHPTREGACAPLTVNSTRKDHTTMDAARAPHPTREGACAPLMHDPPNFLMACLSNAPNKKGSLSAPSIVAYENGG